MTKAELVDHVAARVQLPKYQTEAVVSHVLQGIMEALRTGELGGTDRVQALTFAMQVGLAAVLAERGVRPAAVILEVPRTSATPTGPVLISSSNA